MTFRISGFLTAILVASSNVAIADPAKVLRFNKLMEPVWHNVRLAEGAAMCGLRSDRYFVTFREAAHLYAQQQSLAIGLSSDERAQADHASEHYVRSIKLSCNDLLRGGLLQKLDRIEREITLNYH